MTNKNDHNYLPIKRCLLLLMLLMSVFINAQSLNKTISNGGGTTGSGSTTATGSSAEVGVTAGELSVSLSGSANYNIPFAVPPGINGVVPQIGLSYSSQAGVGIAGYGWNISGLSSITRISSTKFHDGVNDPVDFDILDRYSFDGQRLILKSGTYGVVGSTYETENYSNVKISLLTNGSNDYFKVQYPDGSFAYYGFSTDSKVGLLTYALTYWENPQAIRISYTYTQTNSINYISSIKYGSVGSASPINIINFVYKNRSRIEQSYGPSGINFINDKILDQINIIGNGVGYRNYVLTHDLILNYERLIKVTEKNGSSTLSYNPTVFSYADNIVNNEITSFVEPSFVSFPPNDTGYNNSFIQFQPEYSTNGDFDGDGDLDFIYKSSLYTKMYDDGSTPIISTLPVVSNKISTIQCLEQNSSGNYNLMSRNAWCTIDDSSYPISTINIYSKNITSNTINLEYSKQINRTYVGSYGVTISKNNFTGDFNGDGLTDILNIQTNSIGNYSNYTMVDYHLFFVNLDRRINSNYVKEIGVINLPHNSPINIADVNGDGKSDIIVFEGGTINKIVVYTLDNNDNLLKLWETPVAFQHPGATELFKEVISSSSSGHYEDQYQYANHVELNPPIIGVIHVFVPDVLGAIYNYPVVIGDYNGDGKADIMLPGLERLILISTGSSFVNEQFPSNFPLPHDMGSVMGSDFNNDGKTDLLSINSGTNGSYSINFFNKINVNNWSSSISSYSVFNPALPTLQTKLCPFMIKSSKLYPNKPQVLMFLYTPSGLDWTYKKIGFFTNQNALSPSNKLINKITIGNGVSEKITYANLSDSNGVYSSAGQIENYPNVDISNSIGTSVVSQVERISSTVYKKQLYKYYGATSNIEGLGFLGFRAVLKTNWFADSSQIISNVTNYNVALRGAPLKSFSVLGLVSPTLNLGVSDPYLSKISYDYNYNIFSDSYDNPLLLNKVFKLRNTLVQKEDGLTNVKEETSTLYDVYNNPKEIATTIYADNSNESRIVTESLTYDNLPSSTPYFIGRLKNKIQSVSIYPSNESSVNEEYYIYDANLLKQIKKRAINSGVLTDFITENNDYDAYGNIITKTLKAINETDRISSFQYDAATNRFLTKKTDIQGLVTDYTYNLNNGLLLTESPPFTAGSPLTTTYTYDTWGKKISTKNYLNKVETYTYATTTDGVVKTTKGPAGEDSGAKLIVDDLGRKVHEGTKTIDGNWSYTSTYYNINDQPILVSQPYFVGLDGLGTFDVWNEMKYDVYGRLIQSNSLISDLSTGKQTLYSYSGISVTEDDGQKVKETTKNIYGKVITVTETPTGIAPTSINYEYFANGNLKKTTTSSADTTIEQDGWGRKITLIDPSAGTYKYTYNNFGDTKTEEVVGKGTTTYTLDVCGKVTAKAIVGTGGDNTNTLTDYVYDTSSKLLKGMTFTDTTNNYTIVYSYDYDNYRRLNFTKESRTGLYEFQKDYAFDAFGRAEKEHFLATDKTTNKVSDKWIKTIFKNGYKYQLYDMTSNTVVGTTKLWQTNTVNPQGKVLTAAMGNGITIANSYDVYGFPTQIKHDKTTTNIMILNTSFEPIYGNLISRDANLFGTGASLWSETLSYDNFDRLTTYKDATGVQTQSYANNGTIATNNIGDYAYTISGKPFTLSTITPVYPSVVYNYYLNREQNITYNLFKNPVSITEASKENINFEYNAQNSRSVMYYGDLSATKGARVMRKFYSADGSIEIKRNSTTNVNDFVTYIGGDGYTAPVILKSDGTTKNYFYLHRDYQGTILAVTNSAGALVEKRLFDVWGSLIKYAGSNGISVPPPTTTTGLFLDRGYTGHEHLLGVGLINMNGRIYDDKLHRFLQPDNNLQDPSNSQNYNRYGYGMNNPTKYTDPSGEDWAELFGYLFYTYVSGAVANNGELNPTKWDFSNPGTYNGLLGIASSYTSVQLTEAGNAYMDSYNNHPEFADHLSTYANSPSESHNYALSTQVMWDNINNNKRGNNVSISDLTTTFNIGSNFANIFRSNIGKYDFLRGTYGVSNIIDINEGISAGTFSIYEKGYKEALGQVSFLNNTSKYITKAGYYAGYYDGIDKAFHGDVIGGGVSAASNYTAEYIATEFGWGYGLAFSLTWTFMDKYVSQTELYNRILFGKDSSIYIQRGVINGWYFDNWKW